MDSHTSYIPTVARGRTIKRFPGIYASLPATFIITASIDMVTFALWITVGIFPGTKIPMIGFLGSVLAAHAFLLRSRNPDLSAITSHLSSRGQVSFYITGVVRLAGLILGAFLHPAFLFILYAGNFGILVELRSQSEI